MRKYIYRNVFDTLFHAFLAFGSISKHFHHTNHSRGPGPYLDNKPNDINAINKPNDINANYLKSPK